MRARYLLLTSLATACGGGVAASDDDSPGTADAGTVAALPDAAPAPTEWDQALGARELSYGQALRTAALRLVGDLPTLAETKFVTEAADPAAAYAAMIDAYLEDPRFAGQVRDFFRDAFRMGGGELDSAPNFAAQLVVEERSYLELFTAGADTCPTFDRPSGTFTPGACDSGAPVTAGVLTDPNVMRQFYSNMAFRRVRWIQETFVCTKYPAEWTAEPVDVGGAAAYTSPWPFASIAGAETGGVIDFRDVSAVICANCHTTMNHQAPLFAHFDEDGMWQADLVVPTPAQGAPIVRLEDYLVPGETTAWRLGQPVVDLPAFGQAMAADPAVAECAVVRVWNWAMGKGDVVAALAIVPPEVIAAELAAFRQGDHRLKETIRQVFTHSDFVRF